MSCLLCFFGKIKEKEKENGSNKCNNRRNKCNININTVNSRSTSGTQSEERRVPVAERCAVPENQTVTSSNSNNDTFYLFVCAPFTFLFLLCLLLDT